MQLRTLWGAHTDPLSPLEPCRLLVLRMAGKCRLQPGVWPENVSRSGLGCVGRTSLRGDPRDRRCPTRFCIDPALLHTGRQKQGQG